MNREWMRDIDRAVRDLQERTANLGVRLRGGSGGGGSGGSAGENFHYLSTIKADLPDASTVDIRSFGRVDGVGSDNGMVCVPNPDGDGWDALNFFE